MENSKEIWKDIKGYDNYKISSFGNVKSLNYMNTKTESILKIKLDKSGYYHVGLWKNGVPKTRTVHSLVAESFLNHTACGRKLVINHIDFNKLNNNVDNLEIVTMRENSNRKHIKSSSVFVGVSWYKRYKKWMAQIVINKTRINLGYFTSEIEASNAYQNKLQQLK